MGRLANSWSLAKQSWAVLKADKELMVIPVLSAVSATLLTVLMMGAVYFTLDPTAATATTEAQLNPSPLTFALGAIGTVFVAIITTYFAGALVAGAYERLTGGDPTLSSCFTVAWERFTPLVGWALLSATVGTIINMIQNRGGLVGAFAGRLADLAWRVGSFLAIPVIIVEGVGPFAALSNSVALLKRTWGENLVAQFGFGLIGFLAMLPVIIIGGLTVPLVPVLGIAIIIIGVLLISIVISALNGVYRTALYLYGMGRPSPLFDQQALASAYLVKPGRSRRW